MTDEVYYSALHWAKKAEASAKEAAESAATPGKIIQLGFDGVVENSILVFKHAPGGSEIPYSLVDDAEYEIDLNYASTGSLADNVQMRIKNGNDTINFVSAVHRSSTTPATVGDMKAVMRFNSSTGYRWLFKASFKITPAGAKVFLLYPVVYNDEAVKALQTADAQNVKLTGDQTIGGTKTFTSAVTRSHEFSGNSAKTLTDKDTNGKGSIAIIPYYDGTNIYHRMFAENTASGKHAYLDVIVNDNGNATLKFGGNATAFNANFHSITSFNVPTPTASDNSTKAATTAWVNNILSTLYPIGSVYMGTQSTCPLATLISGSKWEVVATNIVVSVDTNAPVKGTGKALGVTNGTKNAGMVNYNAAYFNTGAYDADVSTSIAGGSNTQGTIGITTDATKSGITATVTRTNLTVNIWKRTA